MEIAKLVLEYLKAILVAPVIGGVIFIVFISMFRAEIAGLIARILSIKAGGMELLTQSELSKTEKLEKVPASTTPITDVKMPEEVEKKLATLGEQKKEIEALFSAERANATIWQFRFLNFYLAPVSKQFLAWLASTTQPPSVALTETIWVPRVPNPAERTAVWNALTNHGLVENRSGLLMVTPKGREYLQFAGKV